MKPEGRFHAEWTAAEDELRRAGEWFKIQEFHYYQILNGGSFENINGFYAASEQLWTFITPLGIDDDLRDRMAMLRQLTKRYKKRSLRMIQLRIRDEDMDVIRWVAHRMKETAQKQGWRLPASRYDPHEEDDDW